MTHSGHRPRFERIGPWSNSKHRLYAAKLPTELDQRLIPAWELEDVRRDRRRAFRPWPETRHFGLGRFLSEAAVCGWRKIEGGKNMPATFRKLVIAVATVAAIAGTTVGSAEARWGWRGGGWGWGWGGFGVGLGTGLLLAAATAPYYGGYYGYGYPYGNGYRPYAYGYPYGYGYRPYAYGYPYGYGYRRAYYGYGYYPRYRYAGYYPYRRYYRYAYY
jgi:hypothetical protein